MSAIVRGMRPDTSSLLTFDGAPFVRPETTAAEPLEVDLDARAERRATGRSLGFVAIAALLATLIGLGGYLLITSLTGAAEATAGVGSTTLSSEYLLTGEGMEAQIRADWSTTATSGTVFCPDPTALDAGTVVDCSATYAGKPISIELTLRDASDGTIPWTISSWSELAS